MINLKRKNNKRSGFTLVETLVALFIFSMSILTVMAVLSQGISSTDYAKNKIIAESLSQEGVEYFRNMRDTFMLYTDDPPGAWVAFRTYLISNTADCENGCYFDNNIEGMVNNLNQPMKGLAIYSCYGYSYHKCPNFYYHPSTGKYDHSSSGGTLTPFSRKITIERIGSPESVSVKSEVTWSSGSKNFSVSVLEHLANWIE